MRKLDKGKLKRKKDRKEKQENTNIKKGGKKKNVRRKKSVEVEEVVEGMEEEKWSRVRGKR